MSKRIALLIALLTVPALAVGTSHWTHTNESDFKNGTLDNVVATNLGDLKLSRAVKTILEQDPKVSAVYSLAAAKDGTIYAGTGPQGVVLRVKGDKVSTLAKLDGETNIFSLAVTSDGALLIGTGGEAGKIYRIAKPGEKPKEIFAAEGVQYVWCITPTPDGKIYAGTGPNGELFEVNVNGAHEVLLDSEENNLLCLASDGKDLLYAGTDPDGLVYRINRKTKEVYILHDAPESEISALALDEQGNLYAATAEAMEQQPEQAAPGSAEQIGRPEAAPSGVPIPAPPPNEPKPPQVPDPNPGEPDPIPKVKHLDVLPAHSTTRQMRDQQPKRKPGPPPGAHPGPTTAPTPPSPGISPPPFMPRAEAGQPREGGNAIYKIDKEGLVTEIFRQPVLVMSMLVKDGVLLAGTGSDGEIYQINPRAEETVVLAKVDAKQVMALFDAGNRIVLGLANTGGISAMTQGFAAAGNFTSPVLDAGQVSRFGKIHLHGALPVGTTLKLQTRSGNISEPSDEFWSKWSEPASAQEFLGVSAPSARFLQYRLAFTSDSGAKRTPIVDDVDVAYQVPNQSPVIKSIKVSPQGKAEANAPNSANQPSATASESHVLSISWEASDPNNDELVYGLFYRTGSRAPWISLKEKLKETNYDWDTRAVADGRYEVKIVASDEQANAPGAGRTTERISDPVTVDNTAPMIADLKASSGAGEVRVQFNAYDRSSALAAFAYTVDAGADWQTVLPSDKIADSPEESVNFVVKKLSPGAHQVAVRATDARGNQSIATVNVTVDAPAKP